VAIFSGGIGEIRLSGLEVMVILKCERKKRLKKLETQAVNWRIACFSFNKI